ncbi:MAG: leucine-rich repeat protein [Clostridia bacterium]|nr:leucine-rich repeat protein [Clostridia bacterium]
MKKRFLLALAAVACLLILVLALPAAAEGEATTTVMGHNLELESAVNIIYYVDFQNAPGGAETGVLVWKNQQESYVYGTEDAKLSTTGINYGYETFIFPGVSSKMMTQDIYAVSYIKNGDKITYSALDKYSVLQYAYNKKGDTTKIGGSKTLGELLVGMLNYGTLAQQYFNYKTDRLANATYYQINVVGGTLPDTSTKGLYQPGKSVTLSSNATEFGYWVNKAGEVVGSSNPIVVTVGNSEETFTAVEYSQGLGFVSNGNGTCYLSGIGTCTDTNIVIPPTSPEGDIVTSIQSAAFEYSSTLRGITIPDSVTSIGNYAFARCSNLESATIGNNVTSIGDYAFFWCTQLSNIEFPDSVTSIGKRAFEWCTALTSINIPESVTSIGEKPFRTCTALASITSESQNYPAIQNCLIEASTKTLIQGCKNSVIPTDGSVTSIGASAFDSCTSLASITIPDSVTSIGNSAFVACYALTTITISNSLQSIGESGFFSCFDLTSITYTGTMAQWNAISKGSDWDGSTGSYIVHCTNGDIAK